MVLFLCLSYAILRSPDVQTRLVRYVTERIEQATGVKMQIKGVNFHPMKSLVLEGILLKDYRNDTLVYCRDLVVKIDSFSLFKRRFVVSEIVFDKAYFNLWIERGEEESVMNIEVFLKALQKTPAPDTLIQTEARPSSWRVDLSKISVRDSRFRYREDAFEPLDYGINWTDVECCELNLDASGFDFSGGKISLDVTGLSLLEKSGFRIDRLDARLDACDSNLLVTQGKIITARSMVNLDRLEYNWKPGQRDWRNFITKMQQEYVLSSSSVSFIDLAYFNKKLLGIENTIVCSGTVFNTVNKIEGKNLNIRLGEESVLNGRFKSDGLPDFWNTVFDIDFYDTHLDPDDLETIYLPWLSQYINIPAPLHKTGMFDVDGNFKGKIEDFVVTARNRNPRLTGNVVFKYSPCDDPNMAYCSELSGKFDFSRVDCGTLSGTSFIGNGSLSGRYTGKLDDRGFSINTVGMLNSLKVSQTRLKNIGFFITYDDNKLNLISSVSSDSLKADVSLSLEMGDTITFMSAKGMVAAELDKLGMAYLGPEEFLKLNFDAVYVADGKHNSFSNFEISDLAYSNSGGNFDITRITVENSLTDGYYMTSLNSDVADMVLEGHYSILRPVDFTNSLIRSYLPAYQKKGEKRDVKKKVLADNVDFYYQIDFKDVNKVLRVVYPDLLISAGSRVYSNYKNGDENIALSLLADTVRYKDISLIKSRIDLKGDGAVLNVIYTADKAGYGDMYNLYNVRNELNLKENRVDNRLTWCNWEGKTYSGLLAAKVKFIADVKDQYKAEITIDPGTIVMADNVWKVKQSQILIDGKNIDVDHFLLSRGGQSFSLNGKISELPEDELSLQLKQFNLEELNKILFNNRFNLFGIVNGNVTVRDYYKNSLLYSDVAVMNWGINKDTLGSLQLKSYWDVDSSRLIINAENKVAEFTPFRMAGYYAPLTDSLNVKLYLSGIGLERLGGYAPEYFKESSGKLSGRLRISGVSAHPDLSGFLNMESVVLNPRMLNSRLFISDSIRISNSDLLFKNFVVKDIWNHTIVIDGFYKLWDNRYNLNIKPNNFLMMNTNMSQSESIYGKVYISGLANIDNMNGITNVTLNARTESNSSLFIPLTAGAADQTENFLHFVSVGGGQAIKKKMQMQADKTGVLLNANLELNDNLEIQVVFDPTIGDILRTTGNGDLKVTSDKDGSINMFGEYKITKGDYLFTMSNLLNKKFVLSSGGNIVWNGSPYDATINLNANYNLKTSLTELMSDIEGETNVRGTKVPVECILNLSDNITNPLVKFDINFPSLDSQTKSYVQSLFSSQDEINKQVFALLIMNKFYTPDYMKTDNTPGLGSQAGTAGLTTVTEMMSSQLSRWLSQISNSFDVGFSYRRGDEITTDEIEVALSTQILNDRVTITANGNMDVGGTKNNGINTPEGKSSMSNSIAGDFDVDVKLNSQGSLKLKAYSHTDEKVLYTGTETIQGIGVSYQETFDTFRELARKYFSFMRRKKN